MFAPKDYISWSSMNLLESNQQKWIAQYIYGERMSINRGMAYGRTMAEALEDGDLTGDPVLDSAIERLPKFEIRDKVIEDPNGQPVEYYDHRKKENVKVKVPFLRDGKKKIALLAKPDSMTADGHGFKEYKTGQKIWTRKQVDESGQITFYATALYLKFGKIPHDIELVQVITEKQDNGPLDAKIAATGDIKRFPTTRTMGQILNMMVRIKKAAAEIERICEKELV